MKNSTQSYMNALSRDKSAKASFSVETNIAAANWYFYSYFFSHTKV